MPKRAKAANPVRIVRRILLVLGITVVLAVGLLVAAYQFGAADPGAVASSPRVAESGLQEDLSRGQGFDYTQTSEGEPVFRIRADRSRQDREDTAFLEGVELDFYREGEIYHVTADSALYNQVAQHAELEGQVVISGLGELVLESRALELRQDAQVLLSEGEVQFRWPPDFVGRASQMRADFGEDSVVLSEGVHVRSLPGAEVEMRLDCRRLIYQRTTGLLRAIGEVVLVRGEERIEAESLTIFMIDGFDHLQSIRARWGVVGNLLLPGELGEARRIDYQTEELTLLFDDATGEPIKVELDGSAERISRLQVADPTGLARSLAGQYLVAYYRGGRLDRVEGWGAPMEIFEFLDMGEPFVLRHACAQRAAARFAPNGDLGRIELEESVELSDERFYLAGGDRAVLDMPADKAEIRGPVVELYNDRGNVTAPYFLYDGGTGITRAEGGVRASLDEGGMTSLASTPLARGEGPIQVEAREALWTTEPPGFVFRDSVRAWRGQSLLLAQQLRGGEDDGELTASGGVKTLFSPEGAMPAGAERQPVEVTAQTLSYRRESGELIYEDRVRLVQDRRVVTCRELTVELGPAGSAERMICQDQVELEDPVGGRGVKGDRAVYTLAREVIEITGENVELRDADGNQIRGKYLLYDLPTGTVQIKSALPAESDLSR